MRRFGPIAHGAFTRTKTQTTNDASPQAVMSLAASERGHPGGLAVTGGSATSIEIATATVSADDVLIGACAFPTGGANAPPADDPQARVRPPVGIIEDNAGAAADPNTIAVPGGNFATGAAFAAFAAGAKVYVQAAGMFTGGNPTVEIAIDFTGGTAPACSVTLYAYDPGTGAWHAAETYDNITSGQIVRYTGFARREVWPRIANISGSPSATRVHCEARPDVA